MKDTKVCPHCQQEFSLKPEFFYYRNKKKAIFYPLCKKCHLADNKSRLNKKWGVESYRRNRDYVDNYKLTNGCSICGYKKCSNSLQFHHTDPTNKKKDVSRLAGRRHSLDVIKTEIEKCVLLCANCHGEQHQSQS